ncbi:hypothetical protein IP81_07580 [Novosphingobium sp. AAP83]|nr:hypothetical protein IP81_07580 [Novosphingobium sp. AAP83]
MRKHRYNQFAHAFANCAKTENFNGHTHSQKSADHGLNIKCVTSQSADIVYAKRIAFTNVFQQIRKTVSIFRKDSTGNTCIGKLTFKVTAECIPL